MAETLSDGRLVSSLRVSDLKEELLKLKLPQKGNKAELLERLRQGISDKGSVSDEKCEPTQQEEPQAAPMDSEDVVAPAATEEPVQEVNRSIFLDPAEEEDEENLDYGGDGAESMIVSTVVEDDGILGDTSAVQDEEEPQSTKSNEEEESSPAAAPVTSTPGRLSLRRSRDIDSFSEGAAQNRKRRWGGSSSDRPDGAESGSPAKVSRSTSSTDASAAASSSAAAAGTVSTPSIHRRLGPVEIPADSNGNAKESTHEQPPARGERRVSHSSSSSSSQRRRMDEEIALQEEAEQRRLKLLREQDALRRQQLLGQGTSASGSAAAGAVSRNSSLSSDSRHVTAAPGASRALNASNASAAAPEPIPPAGSASPPRHASSCTLSLHGLVRPFTLLQLKQLLGRHGPIISEGFWIDRIKSHCYVSFEDESAAMECRAALHGARWPTTSPRLLCVDFADPALVTVETNGLMAVRLADGSTASVTTSAVAVAPYAADKSSTDNARRVAEQPQVDKRIELDARRLAVRERERHERDDRRRSGASSSPRRSPAPGSRDLPHVVEHEEVQAPGNVLDQLFRKTSAQPALYWLPLTDEQADAKEAAAESRKLVASKSSVAAAQSSSRRRSRSRSHSPRSRRQ